MAEVSLAQIVLRVTDKEFSHDPENLVLQMDIVDRIKSSQRE